jgi:hypothetical protein
MKSATWWHPIKGGRAVVAKNVIGTWFVSFSDGSKTETFRTKREAETWLEGQGYRTADAPR